MNDGKINFMGHWYPMEEIRSGLAKAMHLPEEDFDWDELPDAIEFIAKKSPTLFSAFSREMHNTRFGIKR